MGLVLLKVVIQPSGNVASRAGILFPGQPVPSTGSSNSGGLTFVGPTSQSVAHKSAYRKLTSFLTEFLKYDYNGKADI